MDVCIEYLHEDWADPAVPLPAYATAGAAGLDLRANLPPEEREAGLPLAPGDHVVVPTGLRMAIPDGFEVQIRPRSGLAARHRVTILNSPGTIDSDYRGPVGVILINLGSDPFRIDHGARIAQAVIAPVVRARFRAVAELPGTERGAGGFGSTGLS